MNRGVKVVLFPTSDLEASKRLFSSLLGEPGQDAPFYVGFQVGDQQIGLDPSGKDRGMRGATPFFEVDDIAASIAALTEAGATTVEAAHEVGGGMSVAILVDAEGNTIGLSHTGQA